MVSQRNLIVVTSKPEDLPDVVNVVHVVNVPTRMDMSLQGSWNQVLQIHIYCKCKVAPAKTLSLNDLIFVDIMFVILNTA